MKRIWFLIGSFVLGAPNRSWANTFKPAPPPKVEESSPEQDKAALEAASSDADKWAAAHKEEKKAAPPAVVAPPPAAPAAATAVATPPPPPVTAAPIRAPAPVPAPTPETPKAVPLIRRQGLNEMKGKLSSMSDDPRTLRLSVDGGFNVEFTYDAKTSVRNGGESIKVDTLGYNDELLIRYSGKELYAVEIERLSKAPRPE